MSEHIGDDAALYALGILDEVSRRRIDAHVAACDACAAELGDAEAEVATLAAAEPQYRPPAASPPRPPRRSARPKPRARPSWFPMAIAVSGRTALRDLARHCTCGSKTAPCTSRWSPKTPR